MGWGLNLKGTAAEQLDTAVIGSRGTQQEDERKEEGEEQEEQGGHMPEKIKILRGSRLCLLEPVL